jgi:hypothetical protein
MNLNNHKGIILFLIHLAISHPGITQYHEPGESMEDAMPQSEDESMVNENTEALALALEMYLENPLNINAAARKELEQLPFLSEFQIVSILDYQRKYGALQSIFELPYIFGFNREEAQKMAPFVYFGPPGDLPFKKKPKHLAIQKAEFRNSYETSQNIPLKIYNRYLVESPHLQFGITMENDPNEDFFKKTNPAGFDFYISFLEWQPKNSPHVEKVLFGDYTVSFGQGLNLWGRYALGKSIENPDNIRKRNAGIHRYTSANEALYQRGMAATFKHKNSRMGLFVSRKNIDASLQQTDTLTYFSSIQQSGFHVTQSEQNSEKSLEQSMMGCNFSYSKKWYAVGLTYHRTSYPITMVNNQRADKIHMPNGNVFEATSADASVFFKQAVLFGEFSLASGQNKALLMGSNFHLPQSNTLSLVYRDYGAGYYSQYSAGLAEGSATRNEKGFYLGLSNKSFRNVTLNLYADFFEAPWFTYQCDAPSAGAEFAGMAKYILGNGTAVAIKLKTEQKQKNGARDENTINPTIETFQKDQFRLQAWYALSESLTFKNRLETIRYGTQGSKSNGFLLYHDIKYAPSFFLVKLYGRISFFDTESFDARVYQYENDLKYSFYIPFLYGKGIKYYLMAQIRANRLLEIYLKTEYTNYMYKQDVWTIKGALVWKFSKL